jgi:hypothetical protein
MINARRLLHEINEYWYQALDAAYPNWFKHPGKGSYFRDKGVRFEKNMSRLDLWEHYKERALASGKL